LIGYYGVLVQLTKLGITKDVEIKLNSEFYRSIHTMYEAMGDSISMQYGGSKAHHSNTGKKKGMLASLPELITSVKRHYANNFTDPQKQNALNLFLGIY
jgi:phosphatidylinositol 3,5-bisphosphate 5-phosphatase